MRSGVLNLGWRVSRIGVSRISGKDGYPSGDCREVVIAQSDAPHWSWKILLREMQLSTRPSQLIVTSRTADERLWAEVLNLGGYDVLVQPFDRDEVERVIASAARHTPLGLS